VYSAPSYDYYGVAPYWGYPAVSFGFGFGSPYYYGGYRGYRGYYWGGYHGGGYHGGVHGGHR
jgi:hypothetical protein